MMGVAFVSGFVFGIMSTIACAWAWSLDDQP